MLPERNILSTQINAASSAHFKQEGTDSYSEERDGGSSLSPQLPNPVAIADAGDELEQAAANNLQWLVQECGVTSQKISDLLRDLPEPGISDGLVDFYFNSMCVILCARHHVRSHPNIETGHDILFPRSSFVQLIPPSVLAFRTTRVPRTRITFVFCRYYS